MRDKAITVLGIIGAGFIYAIASIAAIAIVVFLVKFFWRVF